MVPLILRVVLVAGLLGSTLAARPNAALACSCQPYTTAERLDIATAAFIGVATAVDESPDEVWPGNTTDVVRQYTVQVTRSWKSPGRPVVELQTARDGPVCGVEVTLGEPYLFFAVGAAPDRLTFNQCNGAGPSSQLGHIIAELDNPGAPAVGSAGLAADGHDDRGGDVLAALLAAAVAAATAVGLLAWGARRRLVN